MVLARLARLLLERDYLLHVAATDTALGPARLLANPRRLRVAEFEVAEQIWCECLEWLCSLLCCVWLRVLLRLRKLRRHGLMRNRSLHVLLLDLTTNRQQAS